MSFAAAGVSLLLLCEMLAARFGLAAFDDQPLDFAAAIATANLAVLSFGMITVGAIRLHRQEFRIAPGRLLRDVAISATLTIAAFALLYRYLGLTTGGAPPHPGCHPIGATPCACDAGPLDQLYFSIVTFTTLGFGDFTPCAARLVAASEALLGTLHLGLFVGGVFYYLNEVGGSGEGGGDESHEHDDRQP